VIVGGIYGADNRGNDLDVAIDITMPTHVTLDSGLVTGASEEEIAALLESGNWLGEVSPIVWDADARPRIDLAELEAHPGPTLARHLTEAPVSGLDDDGLLTVASAWRRMAGWAKAGELATVAEFLDHRTTQYGGNSQAMDAAMAEVQCALGYLTNSAMGQLASLAQALSETLTDTWKALRTGRIDETKAHIIASGVCALDAVSARLVEQRILPKAPEQSTGQLRAAVARAVLAVDPEGAERRRRHGESRRRVEVRRDDEHTASLAGRDLPIADALAADQRITAIARSLKAAGDPRPLSHLRATVYLDLLLGAPPHGTAPPGDADRAPRFEPHTEVHLTLRSCDLGAVPPGGHRPVHDDPDTPGTRRARRAAREPAPAPPAAKANGTNPIRLIVPLDTLRGRAEQGGEIPGFGPVPAEVARTLAKHHRRQPWCYSVLDSRGNLIHHGHIQPCPDGAATADPERLLAEIAARHLHRPVGRPDCAHGRAGPQGPYQVRGSLRHEIQTRDRTCRFPTCRQPATRCDIDHTTPHDLDGPSCPCNLAALCRRHHQTKQVRGWRLVQPEPGRLEWTTPAGRRYTVNPDPYPDDPPF
jgi:hypothetical protein